MEIRRIVIIALFAALMVAGAYIAIPVGPVPITLQTLFVILAGVLGGKSIGLSSVALYLALGAIGLPVFSRGAGGFAHFASPTGGFLISWLASVFIAGFFSDIGFARAPVQAQEGTTRAQLLWIILGSILATVATYAIGLPILKMVMHLSWPQTISIGCIPFLPGDLIKIVAIVLLGNSFAWQVRAYLAGSVLKGRTEGTSDA